MDIQSAIDNAVGTLVVAIIGGAGALVNAWVSRQKRKLQDEASAAEKLRFLYGRLKITPPEINTIDDVFSAIRALNAHLDEQEKKDHGTKTRGEV